MFRVGSSRYSIAGAIGELPAIYNDLVRHAVLNDDFGIGDADGTALLVAVGTSSARWPELVISQRFDPGPEAGFYPGTLLIEETDLLFLSAGTRLLAYDLQDHRRLWEDSTDVGFWAWNRHGGLAVLSAELEFAA